jgi:hypothetical protein
VQEASGQLPQNSAKVQPTQFAAHGSNGDIDPSGGDGGAGSLGADPAAGKSLNDEKYKIWI